MSRSASRQRETKETTIDLTLEVDGSGTAHASTGIPFFDHMLEQLGKHGGFALDAQCTGDLHIDEHHTVEDVALARKRTVEHEERPAAEIDRYLDVRLVHRQQEPVTLDAALVAERALQRLAEGERAVFHSVMLVDVQIARARQLQREAAVLRDLLQHVIEEADAGGDTNRRLVIQPDLDVDVGFLGFPSDGSGP